MPAPTLPLPVGAIAFAFAPRKDWPTEPVAVAFRLRGLLGKHLKQMHCLLDAATSPCEGCRFQPSCVYGSGFESLRNLAIPGFGRVGAAPRLWSLHVDRLGQQWKATLWLIGRELERARAWHEAIASLPLAPGWMPPEEVSPETLRWRSATPVRLRIAGRNPSADELAQALAATIARKARMIAALHGVAAPMSRLEVEALVPHGWLDVERFSFRHGRVERLGGWMLDVRWPDDVGDWQPWLTLMRMVGVGRQVAFGLGRFICLDAAGAQRSA